MTDRTKTFALCADDYGLAPAIDRAIAELAARARLSDVSCIVNAGAHAGAAPAGVRLGLHLNLTEGRPLAPELARLWPELPPLPRLITLAHARRLPLDALRAEMRAQFSAFEQGFGRGPAHVDGHQHVHHLPQIRQLLLECLEHRPAVLVRHTGAVLGPGFAVKRRLIENTGGRGLGRRLVALGRAQNRCLLGVYDFAETDYRGLMRGWLASMPARGALVFCHPGEAGAGDAIATARVRERAYLASAEFEADLREAGAGLLRESPVAVDGEGREHHA
ncbi:MAG: ChbG/HpnK family deacetylase [Burkholderiales bacterium]|nr:ChbG/HpnK family deacetylase [Burkholderiales bacterium]MDE2454895.1 ChbG/HpnK family deacetylase [Burkholderiales bacterium]